MPIDQTLLNEQAAEAAKALVDALAQGIAGITLAERDGYCEIELVNPFKANEPIRISTENAELTFEFGQCHTHFYDYDGLQSEADLVEQMVGKVERIVGGEEASYSAWAGEGCFGGGWLPVNGDGREQSNYFPRADRLQVVAWEPGNDREICR